MSTNDREVMTYVNDSLSFEIAMYVVFSVAISTELTALRELQKASARKRRPVILRAEN